MKSRAEVPTIVVDTREKRPYCFPRMVRRALQTGDYSLAGLEDRIAIERKSKADAYSSIGACRARFVRELERMSTLDYGGIILETGLTGFLNPPPFSKLSPRAAVNSLLAWSVKYGIFVFFADNRSMGQALTRRLLEKFWRYHGAGTMTTNTGENR